MKKYIIANFKMYKNLEEAEDYATKLKDLVSECKEEVVVCPSFICIERMAKILEGTNISVGAQNCAEQLEGAYTGEVSAHMLKSAQAKYVIIGHSERRRYFDETDEKIAIKVSQTLKEDLIPVICLSDEGEGDLNLTIKKQLDVILKENNHTSIILAFEPVWAIGTGKTMELNDIEETLSLVKNIAKEYLGYMPPVLYGGSVTALNSKDILVLNSVDGVLVGGASKNPFEFAKICMSQME